VYLVRRASVLLVVCNSKTQHTLPGYAILAKSITRPKRRAMAHTVRDKTKLLNRVRRIRGQVDAIERALEDEQECTDILLTITACRGAINGLMAEVIEGHIRYHVINPDTKPTSPQAIAAQQLMDVVKTYLK
jgi:DNA-binding FrmR family transcriptional regulator